MNAEHPIMYTDDHDVVLQKPYTCHCSAVFNSWRGKKAHMDHSNNSQCSLTVIEDEASRQNPVASILEWEHDYEADEYDAVYFQQERINNAMNNHQDDYENDQVNETYLKLQQINFRVHHDESCLYSKNLATFRERDAMFINTARDDISSTHTELFDFITDTGMSRRDCNVMLSLFRPHITDPEVQLSLSK